MIEVPPGELYGAWRNLEFLGAIMSHLDSVTCLDDRRSHWTVRGPMGSTLEWDAEIVRDVPNELIGWSSLPGSDVDSAGSVHFNPRRDGRATEVKVVLRYDPPGGPLGTVLAAALGEDPGRQIRDDLLRLRTRLEGDRRARHGPGGIRGVLPGKRSAGVDPVPAVAPSDRSVSTNRPRPRPETRLFVLAWR